MAQNYAALYSATIDKCFKLAPKGYKYSFKGQQAKYNPSDYKPTGNMTMFMVLNYTVLAAGGLLVALLVKAMM